MRKTRLKSMSDKKRAALLDPDVRAKKRTIAKRNALSRSLRQNKQGRKPMAKSNPVRQAKVAKRSAAKHRKYMASATRLIVEERANGQCEVIIDERGDRMRSYIPRSDSVTPTCRRWRCESMARLEHHHLTYARYGGDELPEDVALVCHEHHEYFESLKPAGNRRSRKTAA